MEDKIKVNLLRENIFNNGFVELIDHMGDDLTAVNAARVSFDGNSTELLEKDIKLLDYLARNKHWSVFRHNQFQFIIQVPEFVARQFYKHIVGIAYSVDGNVENSHGFNEISGRYVEATKLGFWIPDKLRLQSKDNKQGSVDDSGGILSPDLIKDMEEHSKASEALYERLIATGVAKEMARSVLPTAFNTKFVWTCSLQALVNFIKLRKHHHAQREIQIVAESLERLARHVCPYSIDALLKY